MSFSKTIYSLIGVFVAVIMIATVAMPAITSASTTTTTTTTTEIQDVEVSDPIYYKPYFKEIRLIYPDENTISIQYFYYEWIGYSIHVGSTSIPIVISDTVVCIVYKDENGCYLSVSGIGSTSQHISEIHTLSSSTQYLFKYGNYGFSVSTQPIDGGSAFGTNFAYPTWNYLISFPEYGGDYITSTSQEAVTLGSLNEIVAGSARYLSSGVANFAYIRNGEQTQYGDQALELDSVQTDAGNVDVSLRASYGDTEVLVLVPTTTEVNVMQTITVQTEYGPILNVVLLMLFIVPVTAVAAMLYTRRD